MPQAIAAIPVISPSFAFKTQREEVFRQPERSAKRKQIWQGSVIVLEGASLAGSTNDLASASRSCQRERG